MKFYVEIRQDGDKPNVAYPEDTDDAENHIYRTLIAAGADHEDADYTATNLVGAASVKDEAQFTFTDGFIVSIKVTRYEEPAEIQESAQDESTARTKFVYLTIREDSKLIITRVYKSVTARNEITNALIRNGMTHKDAESKATHMIAATLYSGSTTTFQHDGNSTLSIEVTYLAPTEWMND